MQGGRRYSLVIVVVFEILISEKLYQRRFHEALPGCTPYQATAARLHDKNTLVDICTIIQGNFDYYPIGNCARVAFSIQTDERQVHQAMFWLFSS